MPVDQPRPSRTLLAALCLALVLATVGVYAQVYRFGFIAYDDDTYVYENAMVLKGLTPSGVAWAFSTFCCANWHPLTWLSHMLDCQLFGLNAGAHHLVNLGFHLANTLLVFIAFVRMTRRPWRSALVAGIFAVHPLHVESVAWISERKDVLSTFLGMVTLLFYVRYAEKPTIRRYAPVALFFALALMAKPMLVTLPFVFLLLDIWPLGRLGWPPAWGTLKRLLWEKAPMMLMVAAACVVTLAAQKSSGAVQSLSSLSFAGRLTNASAGYVSYIGKALWPVALGVLYPIQAPSARSAIGGLAVIVVVMLAAFAWARRRPYVLVGWLWYLGVLAPVIGIVQVGSQSVADRYAYLPLVGLSLAVVWTAAELLQRRRILQHVAAAAACVALILLGVQAYHQAGYWESSRALFERTLAVTRGNCIIHNNLGVIIAREGRFDDAVAHYREALAINPDYREAHANLGHELLRAGKLDESYSHLTKALQAQPKRADVQSDIGTLLAAQGRFDESIKHLEESLRIEPGQADVHSNLGYVLTRLGRLEEAIAHCAEALRLKPESVDAHYNMGVALAAQGKSAQAVIELTRVLALNPNHAGARIALEQLQGAR